MSDIRFESDSHGARATLFEEQTILCQLYERLIQKQVNPECHEFVYVGSDARFDSGPCIVAST